jgi:hypothetical protein
MRYILKLKSEVLKPLKSVVTLEGQELKNPVCSCYSLKLNIQRNQIPFVLLDFMLSQRVNYCVGFSSWLHSVGFLVVNQRQRFGMACVFHHHGVNDPRAITGAREDVLIRL